MKNIIGFATEFYTLWSYEAVTQYKSDAYGNHHQCGVLHNFYYIKNISNNLAKVKLLYPATEIDETLRGKSTSFVRRETKDLPNNIFWGGKYEGRLIDEILEQDFNYCIWSTENYNMPYIKNHPKYIAYLSDIERQKQIEIECAKTVNVGDVLEITFTSNGYNADDNYTECWASAILGDTELKVLCSGVKPVHSMYPYLMPLVAGKTQKTKGKTFLVEVIEVFNTHNFSGKIEQQIKIA